MKNINLALVFVTVMFVSCSTIYKSAQTPDDVYFSPAKNQEEYVRVESGRKKYNYSDSYYDDRYLRMKVNNRNQWNDLDDWFSYDRYSYRYNYFYGTYYNPYTAWHYYYNPYYHNNIIVINPTISTSTATIVKPKPFTIASYSNPNYNNSNKISNIVNVVRTKYNNSNNNYSSGQNNSNYSPAVSEPSRTYSPPPSSNSGSSSGSSSSSSGEVSRPNRGGN